MPRLVPRFIFITLLFICSISFFCFPPMQVYARQDVLTSETLKYFSLYNLDAALELGFEYEDDQNRRPRREGEDLQLDVDWKRKRNLFEQRLSLDSDGSIYHRNLLEFSADTAVRFRQEDYSGDFDNNLNENLWEYDFNFKFIQEKPFNFNLFANQFSNRINQDVFQTTEVDTQNFGAFFQYYNGLFPSSLFVITSDVDEDTGLFKRDRDEDKVELKVSNLWRDIIKSDFRYTYDKTNDRVATSFENIRNDVMLVNVIDYQNVHGTSTIFNYNTSGDRDTNQFQMIQHFYADHSDTFRTLYNFNYTRYNNDTFRDDRFTSNLYQGSFGFLHRLYQSLDTELKGEFSVIDEDDFEEYYYGPRLDLDYRKIVPGGRLSAGWGFLYRLTDRKVDFSVTEENTRRIVGENVTLSDGVRNFLKNANVVINSIVIRDADRRELIENVDYRIVQTGNLIEIRRIGLPNNTPLHIDYEYGISPDITFTTLGNTLYLRYDLKQFFTLYYKFYNTDYHLTDGYVSDDRTNFLADEKSNLYGAEVKWRWFFFNSEYEDDTSDLIPFDAIRFNGRFQFNPTKYSLFSINADHTDTDYKKDRGDLTYDSVYGNYTAQIGVVNTDLEVAYISEDGEDIDDSGWRVSWDVRSRFRSIELEFKADYYDWDKIGEKRENLRLEFKIIRYFDIL